MLFRNKLRIYFKFSIELVIELLYKTGKELRYFKSMWKHNKNLYPKLKTAEKFGQKISRSFNFGVIYY